MDALSKNSLVRFETALKKQFSERLESVEDEEWLESNELAEVEASMKSLLNEEESDAEEQASEEAGEEEEEESEEE